jgi:hypothetical protein
MILSWEGEKKYPTTAQTIPHAGNEINDPKR